MIQKLRTIKAVISTYGVIEILRLVRRKLAKTEPITEFDKKIRWGSASEFLEALGFPDDQVSNDKEPESDNRTGFFSSIYDLGPELSRTLVASISHLEPVLIIETGVAAGKSTNIILESLRKNPWGHLVSVDITTSVGELIDKGNRHLWTLEVLPNFGRRRGFRNILEKNREAVFFLHDSDHSANWQLFEITQSLSSLPNLSLLFIDDIQPLVSEKLLALFGQENCFFLNEANTKKSAVVVVKRKI